MLPSHRLSFVTLGVLAAASLTPLAAAGDDPVMLCDDHADANGVILVGASVSDVFAADLDGDGDQDLLATSTDDSVITVVNDGAGGFTVHDTLDLPGTPRDAAIGDLDGDGDLDAVLSLDVSDTLYVLFNDGSGAFSIGGQILLVHDPDGVAIADLDGDGALDIAASSLVDDRLEIFINSGAGTFNYWGPEPTLFSPSEIAASDIDGDGDIDLAVSEQDGGQVSLLTNNGSAVFALQVPYQFSNQVHDIAFADLDGDGAPEMIGLDGSGRRLGVRMNTGKAEFDDAVFSPAFSTAGDPLRASYTDVDGDGDRDAVIAAEFGFLIVMSNDGTGSFTIENELPCGTTRPSIATADFNGNGLVDLAGGDDSSGNQIWTFFNQGSGEFIGASSIAAVRCRSLPRIADLIGDEHADILGTNLGDIIIIEGNGDGTFESPFTIDALPVAHDVAPCDLDGDGLTDLVYTASERVGVIRGTLGGTGFQQGPVYMADGHTGEIMVADLNGDGAPDVATACGVILLNNGNGILGTELSFASSGFSLDLSLTLSDLNGDGAIDMIRAGANMDVVEIYHNSGDGTMTLVESHVVGNFPLRATLSDLNGDGHDDIAVVGPFDETIHTLIGNGTGSFAAAQPIAANVRGRGMVSVDADLDGDQDLIVTEDVGDRLALLENDGTGQFTVQRRMHMIQTGLDIAAGDVDLNETLDLIVGHQDPGLTFIANDCLATCPADLSGDGDIGVDDLLDLLSQWGDCVDCSGDLNDDGTVGVDDLLDLIGNWGPCTG